MKEITGNLTGLYRELLAADPDDEAASLGLVHNLVLEGKRAEARVQLQQAFTGIPPALSCSSIVTISPIPLKAKYRKVHRIQNTESFFY